MGKPNQMNSIKTEAIVLRNRRYSESSLVVTLLGRECGRLDVLAKGCRRDKSPMFGHLDVYQKEDVLVLRRPQASLDLLIEAGFSNEHTGLRFFPPAFAAAGFLADFAVTATLPGVGLTDFYDVLAGAFSLLSELGDPSGKAGFATEHPFSAPEKNILVGRTLKLALLDMLGWLGYGLELRRCVRCGAEGGGGPAALSQSRGGLICGACRKHTRDAQSISANALAAMRLRGGGDETRELLLPATERRRWLRFLADYCQYVLERPLRGKKVLFQLLS